MTDEHLTQAHGHDPDLTLREIRKAEARGWGAAIAEVDDAVNFRLGQTYASRQDPTVSRLARLGAQAGLEKLHDDIRAIAAKTQASTHD